MVVIFPVTDTRSEVWCFLVDISPLKQDPLNKSRAPFIDVPFSGCSGPPQSPFPFLVLQDQDQNFLVLL